jgi:pimeloyl-ACP methyl ester carboxylesterase
MAITPLVALLEKRESSSARDAVVAALNGVLGDYLADTGNPLAVSMQWCSQGRPLAAEKSAIATAFPQATGKVLVLVHGLCMSDRQWLRHTENHTENQGGNRGNDHGAALARDLGCTPVYLRYNSGLHISANGRELTALLESLMAAWPVPVEDLVIVTHSMGGLVARSACYYGSNAGHRWPEQLRSLIFLGTPHHGAPLERGGHWVDTILGISPYTAPFTRLGKIRSAGITDLRFGDLRDEDWQGHEPHKRSKAARHALPLPATTRCFAVAATTGKSKGDLNDRLLGDGLVPVSSALGRHANPALDLAIPATRQWVGYEMNHMDLLSSVEVYRRIRQWLTP